LFLDIGTRLAELANLTMADLDLDEEVAVLLGKSRRPRACPFGRKTATHPDRYIRARRTHGSAGEPWLWLGTKGRMTSSGPLTSSGTASPTIAPDAGAVDSMPRLGPDSSPWR